MDVVALFAHPDDEAYSAAGTLHLFVRRGDRVRVVSATRGEGGGDAELRSAELAASCAIIGAEPPLFLDLPDGEVAAHTERALARLGELVGVMPDLLISHGADGAYGHVDHLACHRIAMRFGARSKLFAAFPPAIFRGVRRSLRKVLPQLIGDVELGTPLDIEVDIRAVAQLKLQALAAHRSQLPGGDPRAFLRPSLIEPLLEREWFSCA